MTSKNTVEYRIANGLCKRCGEVAAEGGQLCAYHRDKQRGFNSDYGRRRRAFNRRVDEAGHNQDGRCAVCLDGYTSIHLHPTSHSQPEYVLLCETCSHTVSKTNKVGSKALVLFGSAAIRAEEEFK